MKTKNATQRLVIAALIASLTCVATMIIKIPSPLKGYMNLGDSVVLVAGWMLSPLYGFLAAGIGSALADIEPEKMAQMVAIVTTERIRVENLLVEDLVAMGRAPYTNWVGHLQDIDRQIVREAIEAELARGGQVYFVHNKVDDLQTIAGMITRLCPKARVGIGHGRMKADEMEKLIMNFIYGEFDVLVATTIIENGIDIGNANTIIINDAHHFGLSDLHQLRGRVGRSDRKGFCYLLSPPDELIGGDARRRLRAIEEFSDLGSGFNIAMQDLDIRGAGNLLGAEQSGFIVNMGFETYQKILRQAIAELHAEGLDVSGLTEKESEVVSQSENFVDDAIIEIDMLAELPDSYVRQPAEKIRLYRELDSIRQEQQLVAFSERLVDRFGAMPEEAMALIDVVRLRWEAVRLGMERVKVKNGLMIVHFVGESNSPYYKSETFMEMLRRVTQQPDRFVLKQHNNRLAMTVRKVGSVAEAVTVLRNL